MYLHKFFLNSKPVERAVVSNRALEAVAEGFPSGDLWAEFCFLFCGPGQVA